MLKFQRSKKLKSSNSKIKFINKHRIITNQTKPSSTTTKQHFSSTPIQSPYTPTPSTSSSTSPSSTSPTSSQQPPLTSSIPKKSSPISNQPIINSPFTKAFLDETRNREKLHSSRQPLLPEEKLWKQHHIDMMSPSQHQPLHGLQYTHQLPLQRPRLTQFFNNLSLVPRFNRSLTPTQININLRSFINNNGGFIHPNVISGSNPTNYENPGNWGVYATDDIPKHTHICEIPIYLTLQTDIPFYDYNKKEFIFTPGVPSTIFSHIDESNQYSATIQTKYNFTLKMLRFYLELQNYNESPFQPVLDSLPISLPTSFFRDFPSQRQYLSQDSRLSYDRFRLDAFFHRAHALYKLHMPPDAPPFLYDEFCHTVHVESCYAFHYKEKSSAILIPFGQTLNTSSRPNVIEHVQGEDLNKRYIFITSHDVKRGEELTKSYLMTAFQHQFPPVPPLEHHNATELLHHPQLEPIFHQYNPIDIITNTNNDNNNNNNTINPTNTTNNINPNLIHTIIQQHPIIPQHHKQHFQSLLSTLPITHPLSTTSWNSFLKYSSVRYPYFSNEDFMISRNSYYCYDSALAFQYGILPFHSHVPFSSFVPNSNDNPIDNHTIHHIKPFVFSDYTILTKIIQAGNALYQQCLQINGIDHILDDSLYTTYIRNLKEYNKNMIKDYMVQKANVNTNNNSNNSTPSTPPRPLPPTPNTATPLSTAPLPFLSNIAEWSENTIKIHLSTMLHVGLTQQRSKYHFVKSKPDLLGYYAEIEEHEQNQVQFNNNIHQSYPKLSKIDFTLPNFIQRRPVPDDERKDLINEYDQDIIVDPRKLFLLGKPIDGPKELFFTSLHPFGFSLTHISPKLEAMCYYLAACSVDFARIDPTNMTRIFNLFTHTLINNDKASLIRSGLVKGFENQFSPLANDTTSQSKSISHNDQNINNKSTSATTTVESPSSTTTTTTTTKTTETDPFAPLHIPARCILLGLIETLFELQNPNIDVSYDPNRSRDEIEQCLELEHEFEQLNQQKIKSQIESINPIKNNNVLQLSKSEEELITQIQAETAKLFENIPNYHLQHIYNSFATQLSLPNKFWDLDSIPEAKERIPINWPQTISQQQQLREALQLRQPQHQQLQHQQKEYVRDEYVGMKSPVSNTFFEFGFMDTDSKMQTLSP